MSSAVSIQKLVARMMAQHQYLGSAIDADASYSTGV
jgi:hypothetical protein